MRGNVRKCARECTEICPGGVRRAARETNIVWKEPLMLGFSVLYGVFHVLCSVLYGKCTTPVKGKLLGVEFLREGEFVCDEKGFEEFLEFDSVDFASDVQGEHIPYFRASM